MIERGRLIQARFHKGVLLLVVLALGFLNIGMRGLPQAQQPGSALVGSRKVFLPQVVAGKTSAIDLVIQRVEVTQAVQDSNNSVPLIAGRSTMLRIYASISGSSKSIPGVSVAILGSQSGARSTGARQEVTATLGPSASPSLYSSTINFPLPASWTSGAYDLVVTLDPSNAIAESNESNNTRVIRLNFTAAPPLQVVIVPISYTSTESWKSYPAPSVDTISEYIRRIYPVSRVDVTWHAPYSFTGNLKELSDFSALLSQINALKVSERAPSSVVYYGLVPTRIGSTSWFNGGLVGLGYIGSRVSVGLDYTNAGATAAHEIGHNLGRSHAPCGSPSSPDPTYPYPQGTIGHYGLDLLTGTLFGPNEGRDIMSYCNPKWISDYTYKALLNAQLRVAAQTAETGADLDAQAGYEVEQRPVLVVRTHYGSEGARFFPIYQMEGTVTDSGPLDSPYRLQLIGPDGILVSEAPVQPLEIETETGAELFEVFAQLEIPSSPVQVVRLVKDGDLIVEQAVAGVGQAAGGVQSLAANHEPLSPQVSVEDTEGGLRLQWDFPGSAMLRYSKDGGTSWMMLAADVTGGSLVVDPSFEGSLFEVIPASTTLD